MSRTEPLQGKDNYNRPQTPNWVGPYNSRMQPSPIRGTDQIQNQISLITKSPSSRMDSVQYLSQNRDNYKDLGPLLWTTPGVKAALLSDIIAIYPALTSFATNPINFPSPLTQQQVIHVCNCIALFQSIAASPEVRMEFIQARFPFYLYPFLHATNQSREYEMLKMASLGVIGHLASSQDPEVITFLTSADLPFVPLCLRVLKFGAEGNKIVAAFIIKCIAMDKNGISTICMNDGNRLHTALSVLNKIVGELAKQYSPRLARNIVSAYNAILSYDPVSRENALQTAAKDLADCKLAQNVEPEFQKLFLTLTQQKI